MSAARFMRLFLEGLAGRTPTSSENDVTLSRVREELVKLVDETPWHEQRRKRALCQAVAAFDRVTGHRPVNAPGIFATTKGES